jgi:flagellar hook protein FlgE
MAFNTAISGLKAASSDLEVISNNVANASTIGFKSSRAEFADLFASSLLGSSAIGKGVQLANVTQSFAQGSITATDNGLDLAINGNGFFTLRTAGAVQYSRAGAFQVDRDGVLVNADGARLQGFRLGETGGAAGQLGDVRIDTSPIDPRATANVNVALNLDSRETPPQVAFGGPFDAFAAPPTAPDAQSFNATTSTTVFDSLGNPHVLSLFFVKTANANEWEVHSTIDGVTTSGPDVINFQSNGQFDPATLPISVNITGWQPLNELGNPTGAAPQDFSLALSDSTQFGVNFAVVRSSQDGFSSGQLRGLEIDSAGSVFARFSNGQVRGLAQIALASFTNPNGLSPVGGNAWVETAVSGAPLINTPGNGNLGDIQAASLEESNVDLTAQLVRLILAQRNFQANAQVVRSQDSITQSIINLR